MGKEDEKSDTKAESKGDEEVGMCACCGELASLRCSNCRMVFYCKKACQVSHWKSSHKDQCKPFQVSRSN